MHSEEEILKELKRTRILVHQTDKQQCDELAVKPGKFDSLQDLFDYIVGMSERLALDKGKLIGICAALAWVLGIDLNLF